MLPDAAGRRQRPAPEILYSGPRDTHALVLRVLDEHLHGKDEGHTTLGRNAFELLLALTADGDALR
jgi:hypothetical protein